MLNASCFFSYTYISQFDDIPSNLRPLLDGGYDYIFLIVFCFVVACLIFLGENYFAEPSNVPELQRKEKQRDVAGETVKTQTISYWSYVIIMDLLAAVPTFYVIFTCYR